jgi:hypothetical protein
MGPAYTPQRPAPPSPKRRKLSLAFDGRPEIRPARQARQGDCFADVGQPGSVHHPQFEQLQKSPSNPPCQFLRFREEYPRFTAARTVVLIALARDTRVIETNPTNVAAKPN